ncbi:MAG: hypothetical protein ABSA11_16635 [Candidatus Bathyarchaeia archaeon]|jgi:hypothetical protein
MKTSNIILLSVVTLLVSICVGGVIAQPPPSQTIDSLNPNYVGTGIVGNITVSPYIPANDTNSDMGGGTITPRPIIPYPYPYQGNNNLVQFITQLLTTAKDGTYTGLSISTQNGVTTIKADEVTVTSDSFSVHITGFMGVIDNNKNMISVTASLIDYKDGTTTFYGKDVSFSSPIYPAILSQGVVIPPTPAGGK